MITSLAISMVIVLTALAMCGIVDPVVSPAVLILSMMIIACNHSWFAAGVSSALRSDLEEFVEHNKKASSKAATNELAEFKSTMN